MHLKKQKRRPKRSLAALDGRQTAGGVVCKEASQLASPAESGWAGKPQEASLGEVPVLLSPCPYHTQRESESPHEAGRRGNFNWVVMNTRGSYEIEA